MIDNGQNSSNNNSTSAGSVAKMPSIQASPSGGVVATLQPGQHGFEDKIKVESGRKDNFVVQESGADFRQETTGKIELPQTVSQGASLKAETAKAETKQTPTSVLNYKVGNDLEKKQKKSIFLPILFAILGLAIVGALIYYFYEKSVTAIPESTPEPQPEVVTLDYWGLWEPSETLTQVLKDFEADNPGVSVHYVKQDIDGYRQRLQNALIAGNGPDVFRYHASWRSYLNEELDTLPSAVMTTEEFGEAFYPVAAEQLTDDNGQIKGIPLMYDGLALLYNKDLYAQAGLEVPRNWTQFRSNAQLLTRYGANDYIETSGAAMGLADNINFVPDTFGLLLAQSGADSENIDAATAGDVLTFYTNFYNAPGQRIWDETFANSMEAFARGETAMILAPSWMIHDVLEINPNLSLGVASVPQLDEAKPVDWATYWVEGVNTNSSRKEKAWKLLSYLSSEKVLRQLYEEQASIREFGEIYPRPAMADLLAENPYVQPYLVNAERAVGFPLNDKTFDDALDDANKNWTATIVNQVTIDKKSDTVDLARMAEQLVNGWTDNLIEYGYLFVEE